MEMSKARRFGAEAASLLTRWCCLFAHPGAWAVQLDPWRFYLSNGIWKVVLKFVCVLICLCSYWVGSVEVLDCQCCGSVPGLRSCPRPALGLWLKVIASVWCENSQKGEKEQHWLPRWAFWWNKIKKPKYVGGSRRGELVSKQIPKADGAGRMYWSEMLSALTQKLWVTPESLGCELRAAGWQGWPCHSKTSLHLFITGC